MKARHAAKWWSHSLLLPVALIAAACNQGEERDAQVIEINDDKPETRLMTWEEFRAASTMHGPEGTTYVAEGDLPFPRLEDLETYYYEHYLAQEEKLAVKTFNDGDDRWFDNTQTRLEYCVSTSFPASGVHSRANVIAAMRDATQRWKEAANVHFTYVPAQDSDCTPTSTPLHERFFKVAPDSVSGNYACAFWPASRSTCASLDGYTIGVNTSLTPPISETRTLTHELGHVLGMWHEYNRSEGGCPATGYRALTNYDANSIMHASSGTCSGSPVEDITQLDQVGMTLLYGLPPAILAANRI